MELQHSQTWKNLQTAFSGELHACAKYKIYALRAREDGYEQMGNIFDETSRNEQEHAEIWLKHLSGGELSCDEADSLLPARQDFVAVWRYLAAFSQDGTPL